MSIADDDRRAGEHAVAPRVFLRDIQGNILHRFDFTADKCVGPDQQAPESLSVLSICILVMRNGFSVIGHSAPASPRNFRADLGRTIAYENAIRQLWPLEGYSLRDRLMAQATAEE